MIQLTWRSNPQLSALHLAYCCCNFAEATTLRQVENRQELQQLRELAESLDVAADRFWDLAFQLSVDSAGCRDLVQRLSVRCLPAAARTESLMSRATAILQSVFTAANREQPEFAKEIALRESPIRQQWEAYGPGLWHQLGQWIEPSLLVEQAEVFLVVPAVGGLGWPHLQTNRVHIEALLANSHPQIAEVIRLCWLLSQLDFERPRYSDLINSHRLRKVSSLAMLPPILNAAQALGLCSFDAANLAAALIVWRVEPDSHRTTALAEVLMVWWETFQSGQIDWAVALTGLDRMLSE